MESANIQAGISDTWEDATRVRTGETSTVYRAPTCNDSPSSPEQQPDLVWGKELKEEIYSLSKRKPPAAASSMSKQSTVTWPGAPLPRHLPPESTGRFSVTSQSGYRENSTKKEEPPRSSNRITTLGSLSKPRSAKDSTPQPPYSKRLDQSHRGSRKPTYSEEECFMTARSPEAGISHSDMCSKQPSANPFCPGRHPYPPSPPGIDTPLSAMEHRHYDFHSHPAPRNWHPQEQSPQLAQVPKAYPYPPSPVVASSKAAPEKDIDPIQLVEDYLESLRRSKEKELLEAYRILSWINQRQRKEPEKCSRVFEFQVADNEFVANDRAVPTVVSFARTTERAQSMDEAPTPTINHPRQPDEESMTERLTGDFGDVSIRSLYSDNTVRPCLPSRYKPSIGPPKTVIHDPVNPDTDDSVANNQSNSDTSDNSDDNSLLEEINSLRQDNASLRQQLDRKDEKWFGFNIFFVYARWKKSFRNRPALGKRRVYWTCECGQEMFADLNLTNNSDCQRMLEFLNRPSDPRDQDQTTPSQLEGGTAQMNYITPNPSQSSLDKGKVSTSTISSGTTWVGSSGSQSSQLQSNGSCTRAKYLELCVNTGKYKTKLVEIQVTAGNASGLTICTDGHLFRKIYTRYFELRKDSWRRFLYQPAGIKFVHFAVQHNEEVIFYSENQYPTDDVLASKLYEYDLRPPIPPPMDSRTFLHYFYEHGAHSQLRSAKFVHRLPKKIGESLVRSIGPEEFREGWGIHIIEGPNKVAICWALMIVLAASFGVSLGYDLITKSGDSGFAIGQWMVAALTVALSALYFSLEDEVNSSLD